MIGALRVNLAMDSAKFSRGMTDAQKRLKVARTQFLAVASSAVALAGGLSALTISTSRVAAEIKTMSSVANAAPEELQRWAAGAATVGIEQEKLADILKDVNDRVGDFVTTGGGPMADFFENVAPKIGITADAFRDLSGPQALQLYVSSLEKAGLSQQEMTFYLEAMASDATALIPLLRNGGKEMERLGDNAASLGGVMSSNTVASLNSLKLAMADAGTAISGVGYRISGELAPALTAMATAFADAMREGGALRETIDFLIGNIDTLVASAGVAVAAFGTKLVYAMALASGATGALSAAFVVLKGAIFATGVGALIISAGYLIAKLLDLVKETGGWANALSLLGDVAAGVWEGIKISAKAIPPALGAVWELVKAGFYGLMEGLTERWSEFLGMIASSRLADVPGFGGLRDSLSAASADAFGKMSEFNAAAQASARAAGQMGREAAGLAGEGFDKAREALEKLKTAATDASGDMDDGMDPGSTSPWVDALGDKGKGAGKAANDAARAAKTLADEIQRLEFDADPIKKYNHELARLNELKAAGLSESAYQYALDKLNGTVNTAKEGFKALQGAGQSAFESLITGATSFKEALAGVLQSMASFFAQAASSALFGPNLLGGLIPKFATGTPYAPGGLSLVGERGPELVNLPRGSQVLNANQTRGAMGGGGGVVRIVIEENEMFASRVRTEATGVAVEVTRKGISQNNRAQADTRYLRGGS